MLDEVTLTRVAARPTAVVAAATTWQEFPGLWGGLLDEVWACLRAGGIHRGCRNVMLYLDDVPHVEVGVLLDRPCPLTGRVRASSLPAGTVARTVHRGPFTAVGEAHDAILRWCADQGLHPDGTRWEVYGPHDDDPVRQWTEVCWRLPGDQSEAGSRSADQRSSMRPNRQTTRATSQASTNSPTMP